MSTSASESYPSCICEASTLHASLSSGSENGPSVSGGGGSVVVFMGSVSSVGLADRVLKGLGVVVGLVEQTAYVEALLLLSHTVDPRPSSFRVGEVELPDFTRSICGFQDFKVEEV
eukprot:3935602-Rhodomonas_salina.1